MNCGIFFKKFFCLMIQSLSCLTFGLGQDPSLSSALGLSTFRNSHSNRSSYCSYVSFVMYITTDTLWSPSASVQKKKKKGDTPLSDGWIRLRFPFLVLRVNTSVIYRGPITPTGLQTRPACFAFLQQECAFLFVLLVFRGIWWHNHASYPGGRQTALKTQCLRHGFFFFFLKRKNAGKSVQRSPRWCITLSHTLNEFVDVCRL